MANDINRYIRRKCKVGVVNERNSEVDSWVKKSIVPEQDREHAAELEATREDMHLINAKIRSERNDSYSIELHQSANDVQEMPFPQPPRVVSMIDEKKEVCPLIKENPSEPGLQDDN